MFPITVMVEVTVIGIGVLTVGGSGNLCTHSIVYPG